MELARRGTSALSFFYSCIPNFFSLSLVIALLSSFLIFLLLIFLLVFSFRLLFNAGFLLPPFSHCFSFSTAFHCRCRCRFHGRFRSRCCCRSRRGCCCRFCRRRFLRGDSVGAREDGRGRAHAGHDLDVNLHHAAAREAALELLLGTGRVQEAVAGEVQPPVTLRNIPANALHIHAVL